MRSSRARSRRGSGRVTIKDVAAHADASLKTVSRVLNNEPNVRSATRQRIEETIAALGYRPSTSARSLAGRHAYVVGLTYGNPRPGYLVDVLSGVLDHCREAGYELFLYPFRHDDPDVVANIAKVMRHADVGGLILSPPLCDNGEVIRLLDEIDLPFARISASGHADHPSPYVTLDDRAAARDMTDYLFSLGHRRVGFIGGPENHPSAHLRLDGYRDALAARGVAFDGALVVPGAFTLETGRDGAAALLALGEKNGPPPFSPATTKWRRAPWSPSRKPACRCPRTCRWPASTIPTPPSSSGRRSPRCISPSTKWRTPPPACCSNACKAAPPAG